MDLRAEKNFRFKAYGMRIWIWKSLLDVVAEPQHRDYGILNSGY